ncbi:hypothetical protein ASC77_18705 [Nocardioides sp. Root1257]|uniref:2-keto-4-pentenoate hydratase n=1 Tax=unclassified Nocardioides TaxID=2615069 RepID=UPI0006F38734|nr:MULTISPECIES: fumarylacetoacetate hydrolase family protein [unclassified Nocardioides]KQW45945.1 hypothetical protein ASC77_18705 [Nocardioides sp. Root1257]KRC43209.1 hypothetical protein ASE24_19670 [Nocardioides sp. Root224]
MKLTDGQRISAAQALFAAERDRAWIEPLTVTYPEIDIEDAYRISMLVTEMKTTAGHRVVGHKIGLTSEAMRKLVGVDEPDYGTLFDTWMVPDGSVYPADRLNHARVEIELAFVLNAPIDVARPTAVDVIRATEFVLPAMEIVDSRFRVRGNVIDSIADAATCGGVVLGSRPMRLGDLDIRDVSGNLEVNGEVVERGSASASMGNPVNAVAWLAGKLHEFGISLHPGDVVLSGSFIRAPWISPGEELAAHFEGCGSVSVTVGAKDNTP